MNARTRPPAPPRPGPAAHPRPVDPPRPTSAITKMTIWSLREKSSHPSRLSPCRLGSLSPLKVVKTRGPCDEYLGHLRFPPPIRAILSPPIRQGGQRATPSRWLPAGVIWPTARGQEGIPAGKGARWNLAPAHAPAGMGISHQPCGRCGAAAARARPPQEHGRRAAGRGVLTAPAGRLQCRSCGRRWGAPNVSS